MQETIAYRTMMMTLGLGTVRHGAGAPAQRVRRLFGVVWSGSFAAATRTPGLIIPFAFAVFSAAGVAQLVILWLDLLRREGTKGTKCCPLHSRRPARYNSNFGVVAIHSGVGNRRFLSPRYGAELARSSVRSPGADPRD